MLLRGAVYSTLIPKVLSSSPANSIGYKVKALRRGKIRRPRQCLVVVSNPGAGLINKDSA